jgi:heat shock protein HtpX
MVHFHDLNIGAADWRYQLAQNNKKTKIVIATFILLYFFLGILIDVVLQVSTLHHNLYTGEVYQLTIMQALKQLFTLQQFPIATLITTLIALVSLWVTFAFYKNIVMLGTNYHEVTESSQAPEEQQLYHVVEEMKIAAGLQYMPKIFIIDAPYMNAFASGYSEKSALVAITRGLLEKLDRSELQAVMAHELSHIRHMDIKLTLMASVLANLMLIMIDVLFWSMLYSSGRKNSRDNHPLFLVVYLLRLILPLITMLLTLYLSRVREKMADAGAVELTRSNEPLARALLKIQQDYAEHHDTYAPMYAKVPHEGVRKSAYLFDPTQAGLSHRGFSSLFSTHPPLKERLAAIGVKIK